jgi:hypothetical protein
MTYLGRYKFSSQYAILIKFNNNHTTLYLFTLARGGGRDLLNALIQLRT